MRKAVSPGSGPRRGRRQPTSQLMGRWRITEMELWELDDLDLLGPAQIALEHSGRGRMNFISVDLLLDYQLARRDNRDGVEFTFDGSDEGDRVSGRGWAVLDGQQLRGHIYFHQGDDSGFVARRLTGRQGTRQRP